MASREQRGTQHAMFDLSRDIGESDNQADPSKTVFQQLLAEWERWNAELKDRTYPTLSKDVWWE